MWLVARAAWSQDDPLYVRVVDVGAGLCCVVVTPDQHHMDYDAGNYKDQGSTAIAAIRELVPAGATIDLLVLSHRDADHLAAAPAICDEYKVQRVIRDGLVGTTQTWKKMKKAIRDEVQNDGCEDLNLKSVDLAIGTQFTIGQSATATFVSGFSDLPDDWPELSDSEDVNARSIIVRLEFGGHSILFCGDAVGRHIGDSGNVCIAEERFMVDNAATVPIDSDVIIAPHHGADNGSSRPFIQTVSPEYVIFSAGSHFEHPRAAAAERYVSLGVDINKMFRTDRGDNEGGAEWASVPGAAKDGAGDDDVEIRIPAGGTIDVRYRQVLFAPAPIVVAAAPRAAESTLQPARRGLFRRAFRSRR